MALLSGETESTGPGAMLKTLSQPRQVAVVLGNFLKPEILSRHKPTTRSETAYLDGLRGVAALLVCFAHLTTYTHPNIELCYGQDLPPPADADANAKTPAQLPFLRILFSGGQFSVALFFCISGFVLTQRLVGLLHAGRRDDFVRSVHSSMFRRPLRVFLPVVWSTFAFATFWHVTGWATPWPPRQPDIVREYWSWFLETSKFMFVFRRDRYLYTYYNVHTWTILVELQGSMLVFVWLFVMHHVPARPRILLTLAAICYLAILTPGGWFACFFAGMLTGEMYLVYSEDAVTKVSLPWDRPLRALWARPILYSVSIHALLIAGLYLASQPTYDYASIEDALGRCHGWVTLSKLIPSAYDDLAHRWFWLFWASWILTICAREVPWLRYLLNSSFSQYLGRHSFALYLIHGPMIGIFSERLFWLAGVWPDSDPANRGEENIDKFGHLYRRWYNASWWPFSNQGPRGLEPNYLFCAFTSILVFLYVAEIGTKLFDTPSFNLSRRIYRYTRGP